MSTEEKQDVLQENLQQEILENDICNTEKESTDYAEIEELKKTLNAKEAELEKWQNELAEKASELEAESVRIHKKSVELDAKEKKQEEELNFRKAKR